MPFAYITPVFISRREFRGLLKRLVAILIFIGVLTQVFSKVVILAEFYANRDFIAKNLCENRNKPGLHCNGKCHLMKKLSKDEDQTKDGPSKSLKEKHEVQLFFADNDIEVHFSLLPSERQKYYSFNDLRMRLFPKSVFHPPSIRSGC
jgi:hypothetical protein